MAKKAAVAKDIPEAKPSMLKKKDGEVKVCNKKLAGETTNIGDAVVEFDENGEAIVDAETAELLSGISDFTILD